MAKMMVSRQMTSNSKLCFPVPTTTAFRLVTNASPSAASESACSAYERYVRLPELKMLWSLREFPAWRNEGILRPALSAVEITFRLVSTVFSDTRTYINQRRCGRRLESLLASQIAIISQLVEAEAADPDTRGTAPIVDAASSGALLPAREGSHAEIWKTAGDVVTVVCRACEGSLLPRLGAWRKSEDVARRIMFSIECYMGRCPYTLGIGEPNLTGKPNLDYDSVCRPTKLGLLNKSPIVSESLENQAVYSTHQILECWIHAGMEILTRHVVANIENKRYKQASDGCDMVVQIWKLLSEVEDLLLLADPEDLLRLRAQLLAGPSENTPACFRSRGLVELTKRCSDVRHKVPEILGVEADPMGGPRVQEAAMRLYREGKREGKGEVELLQGMQSVEKGMKSFYYGYKQLMVTVMGSLEANGNRAVMCDDPLAQIFLEPTYFPSLDAAKTFLGSRWTLSPVV